MVTSIIIWIILGSACVFGVLVSAITVAWMFGIIKRIIWGVKKQKT